MSCEKILNEYLPFFDKKKIPIKEVISSEWCRCKETASIAFSEYKTEKFLNSFFSEKFKKNKNGETNFANNF